MQLEDMIRKTIEEECEDYFFGVADLSLVKKLIVEHEGSLISEYPKAISIGITMPPIVPFKLLSNNKSFKYNYNDYDEMIKRLNLITTHLNNFLKHEEYKSLPILIASNLDDQRTFSAFSHELIANLAGLGWIGPDGLLITPEVGSGVLWSTILTDAPLKVTRKPLKEYSDFNKFKTIYSSMDE